MKNEEKIISQKEIECVREKEMYSYVKCIDQSLRKNGIFRQFFIEITIEFKRLKSFIISAIGVIFFLVVVRSRLNRYPKKKNRSQWELLEAQLKTDHAYDFVVC